MPTRNARYLALQLNTGLASPGGYYKSKSRLTPEDKTRLRGNRRRGRSGRPNASFIDTSDLIPSLNRLQSQYRLGAAAGTKSEKWEWQRMVNAKIREELMFARKIMATRLKSVTGGLSIAGANRRMRIFTPRAAYQMWGKISVAERASIIHAGRVKARKVKGGVSVGGRFVPGAFFYTPKHLKHSGSGSRLFHSNKAKSVKLTGQRRRVYVKRGGKLESVNLRHVTVERIFRLYAKPLARAARSRIVRFALGHAQARKQR